MGGFFLIGGGSSWDGFRDGRYLLVSVNRGCGSLTGVRSSDGVNLVGGTDGVTLDGVALAGSRSGGGSGGRRLNSSSSDEEKPSNSIAVEYLNDRSRLTTYRHLYTLPLHRRHLHV